MPKISWNDIADQDSSLSSENEEIVTIVPQKKTVLSTASKLKNACDQMSLRKLQSHQSNDVWLYIPNSFYERGDEVNAILEKNQELKKVYKIKSIGWNVLTSKQIGKHLIEQGLQQENIFIKFIYSNKNQQKMNGGDQKIKLHKKVTYIQKNNKKEEKGQDLNGKLQKKDEGQKKKVKYIQKSKSMINELINQFPTNQSIRSENINISTEGYKSPKKWSTNSFKSPSKYQTQQIKQPKKYKLKQQVIKNGQNKQIQAMVLEIQKQQIKNEQRSMVTEAQPTKNIQQGKVEEVESDQSIQKQQKKKKKKKNNKKNKQDKVQKIDQNPFSYFMK